MYRAFNSLNKEYIEESHYNDSSEEYIFNYIEHIENFISNYGYNKRIGSINSDSTVSDIEDKIRNFLILNANAWNHLDIFGTLKEYSDREIYVCCYEPYGEEVLCVENISNELFFFDISKYENGIKMHHINPIEKAF